MAKPYTIQQRSFRNWQRKGGAARSTAAVARRMGRSGVQLRMWATGNRSRLPLGVAADLSIATSIPLHRLLTNEQRKIVEKLDQARSGVSDGAC